MFRRGDKGFTLIELLVAIAIIGIITVPLSNVVIGFLHNSDATTARLTESHDAQIASAYWAQDVSSIGTRATTSPYALNQSIETGAAYNSGLYPCGASGTPAAIVRLAWDDYANATSNGTIVRVAYVVETVSGQTQLHRIRCNGSSTPISDTVLAHDLIAGTPPTVTCSSTCTAAPAVPATVVLNLTIQDPKNTGAAYAVNLTGQRRQT
jgi:prepilin-type N-terminal cleavage/methylation domain-containing protein